MLADPFRRFARYAPGILLAAGVGVLSLVVAQFEERFFGHPIIEGLVVAILIGMIVRSVWDVPEHIDLGVRFTAKQVLEAAVFLLGASVDLPLLLKAGPALAIGIVLLVFLGISASFFTVRALSGELGTLCELVRVLMLGPVVLFFALRHRGEARRHDTERRFSITRFVPWFIIGFLLLAALRSTGVLADRWLMYARALSIWLTLAAMAALGLGVDVRVVRRVGRPVIATVSASLVVLIVLAVTLIRGLHIR